MKTFFYSIITLFLSFSYSAQTGSISLPEMSVLYKGWNNKIIPMVPCNAEPIIEVTGGTAVKTSWFDADSNLINGYFVNVGYSSKYVTIKLSAKEPNGTLKSYGSFIYKAKYFPGAQLQGTTISKTTGFKAVVSLGPDSPFTGAAFVVLGGEITIGNETIPFSGNRVPSSVLEKVKPGKKVSIDVTYKRQGATTPSITSTVLSVVP